MGIQVEEGFNLSLAIPLPPFFRGRTDPNVATLLISFS